MCAFVPAAWPAARAERCCGDEAARHERENKGLASESTPVLIPPSVSFWGAGFVVQVVFLLLLYHGKCFPVQTCWVFRNTKKLKALLC